MEGGLLGKSLCAKFPLLFPNISTYSCAARSHLRHQNELLPEAISYQGLAKRQLTVWLSV